MAGTDYVWANGTLLCTVKNGNYTYYHTDHLGTSKLQTDGQGKILTLDITKPYGPVAKDGIIADTFADLSRIDPRNSRFTYDQATGTILPPRQGREGPKQITDNHEVTVEKTEYETVKAIRLRQTAADRENAELAIEFDHLGRARLTVRNDAGRVVFREEYSANERRYRTVRVEVGRRREQSFTVELELAAGVEGTPARNTVFSVSWGEAEADYGFLRTRPVTFPTDVYAVRLSYTGSGVTFYLNTGGRFWQRIEPGEEVILDRPGRTLTIRVILTLDEGTNLQDYELEINPYHDMSFTGKFLEPEIGLIYFGGRWYEPGIGRWITPDPACAGINWYEYCRDNPIAYIDADGQMPVLLAIAFGAAIYWMIANEPDATPTEMIANAVDAIIYSTAVTVGAGRPVVIILKAVGGKVAGSVARHAINNQGIDYWLALEEGAYAGAFAGAGIVFGKIKNFAMYKLRGVEPLRNVMKPHQLKRFRVLKAKYPQYFNGMTEDSYVKVLSSKEVQAIRAQVRVRGHHTRPIAFGGEPNPPPQFITKTGETRFFKDAIHTEVTNFWNEVLRDARIARGLK
ncbi:MAG: RHS repeat-associated core domain-containing protein [Firmicutes bacterium]|nr:RHS repeat-associated core domain-containing protein [Bacillota bacterium]